MSVRFPIQPRMISPEKAARRLGVTTAVFAEKRQALEAAGFPKAEPVLGNYCLEAVDKWIDAQAGLAPAGGLVSDRAVIAERLRTPGWGK